MLGYWKKEIKLSKNVVRRYNYYLQQVLRKYCANCLLVGLYMAYYVWCLRTALLIRLPNTSRGYLSHIPFLKQQSTRITTSKPCCKLYQMECMKFCNLTTLTKKLLDEVSYIIKTIYSHVTTKNFRNLSTVTIQLIKKAISVSLDGPWYKFHWCIHKHKNVHTSVSQRIPSCRDAGEMIDCVHFI